MQATLGTRLASPRFTEAQKFRDKILVAYGMESVFKKFDAIASGEKQKQEEKTEQT